MKTSMIRLFKPGDRVQRKSGGPVMIVQKYAREHSILLGWYESNYSVECSWLGPNGFHKEIINQNNLKKATASYRKRAPLKQKGKDAVRKLHRKPSRQDQAQRNSM